MKKIFVLGWMVVMVLGPWSAVAADEAKLDLAMQVVKLDGANNKDMLNAIRDGALQSAKSMGHYSPEMATAFDLIFDGPEMAQFEKDTAAVYASVFTVEELQGILQFYQSPTGKSMLEKMPEVARQLIPAQQKMMESLMPRIQRAMMGIE